MERSRLIKIIDDFFKAVFCMESFPYPLNQNTVDVHILNKVKLKENEIKKLESDVNTMYSMNEFIPIIPKENDLIYKCQHEKVYKNITKLSELILELKKMGLDLNKNILSKILDRKIDGDFKLSEDDIKKFDDKMNLFDYLAIKQQRKEYIDELKIRVKKINDINKNIYNLKEEIRSLKNKPSYELIYNIGKVEDLTRIYFIKKATIFFMTFRNEFQNMKLTKEVFKLKKNNFNWTVLTNMEIEKVIDFICIFSREQLIKEFDSNLGKLIKKLYYIRNQIEKIKM